MELITYCKACREVIKIKSSADTRSQLERERGIEFLVNCTSCGKDNPKHVNDIRARESKAVMIGAGALGVLIAVILIFVLGAIGTAIIAAPIYIWRQQSEAASRFNRRLLPRR